MDALQPQWAVDDVIANRWQVHDVLDGGGMGTVYVVYDREWRTVFAAKTLKAPRHQARFLKEAHIWVHLDRHPNVCRAQLVEEVQGQLFLFLDFAPDGDLRERMRRPGLVGNLPEALRLVIQACDGLQHAYERGVTPHRDLKPANLLLAADALWVSDFGLARLQDTLDVTADDGDEAAPPPATSRRLTQLGSGMGTPQYMAPEQFLDASAVDYRADLYALGVVLFEMLAGHLPFLAETTERLAHQHLKVPPPPLGSGDTALDALLAACLAKNPAARPASFAALRQELARIFERRTGRPVAAPAAGAALNAIELNNKGANLARLGHPDEAETAYREALRIDPNLAQAWSNLGVLLVEQGRPDEAETAYREALRIDPNLAQAWFNLGVLLVNVHDRPCDAVPCFERALALGDTQAAEALEVCHRACAETQGAGG